MTRAQMLHTARNPALFPAFVAQHSVAFDSCDHSDYAVQFPGVAVPKSLTHAAPKRRMEYCAGRFCARQALRVCAPEQADAIIPSGPQGEPLWPTGIVGAITHTNRFASVAVARTRHVRAIGIDTERMMVAVEARDVLDYVATPDEISALVSATQWEPASIVSVVFSAKEAIFKCLFPEVRRYFDFHDATIDSLDTDQGRFSARLLVSVTSRLVAGTRLGGRFECSGDWVHTAMMLEP
ncbi:4'-phosphopantetheinyl transferase family protein [Bradyrhizobium sp. B120]|uniref:4'-phosphopantetheinyl transferase family protein n=1 Tax=Bradyrhizobium sp. B120 TaxID=3410088 RepID=UPI003B9800C6